MLEDRQGRNSEPAGRYRTTVLGRGPVWRGSSIPSRRRRSALGVVIDKALGRNAPQVEGNETGRAIWDLCDGVRTLDEIVGILQAHCDGERGEIHADVLHAVQVLADAGLLTSSDHSTDSEERCIDLRDIPILVITSEDRPDRRAFMERQMAAFELPFSFVMGARHAVPAIGCAEAHLKVLNLPGLKTPFLALEDDCEFTDRFHYRYILPDETDALYLGASWFGLMPPGDLDMASRQPASVWKGVRFTRFGPNYLRVLNMLGGHARVYLTEAYREAVTKKAEVLCKRGRHMDVVQAGFHLSRLVLTPNELVCHQNKALGGRYQATCRSLLEFAGR